MMKDADDKSLIHLNLKARMSLAPIATLMLITNNADNKTPIKA